MNMRFLCQSALFLAMTLSIAARAAPVDDLRISQLEQDLRELQREVRQQARRIEKLESQLAQSKPGATSSLDRSVTKSVDASVAWLNVANWDKVRPGMVELEVLRALGPPTTLRKSDDGAQMLYYALELGPNSFLSGHVKIADRAVSDVQKPTFK